ncbi:hypothetical protein TUM3794_39080 [Shewanella colwelliana]|uniref:O-antigen ligase-related domain-containing protein n=1 Tax=Shewanella colwelliana TaxID=23 RepID=A0ABQ4PFZ9_SHECO|nr:O-antigen ligase family protein [Shewanella colwelliana]GIU46460.1 hypothetical protein TUM3794_39080 [Shewanella colwelliana]
MELKTYSWALLSAFVCIFLLGTIFGFDLSYVVDNEYDLKRVLVIGFVWLSSLFFVAVKDIEVIRLSLVTKLCLSSFFILATCSAFYSIHPFWGVVELCNLVLLVAAFFLFVTSIRITGRDRLYLGVYFGFLFFSVLTLVKYILFLVFSYADEQSFDIHGLLSGYVNVRFFNQLQVMIVAMLLLPFCYQDLTKFKRVSIAIISLHWAVMLQTEARGAILSLISAFCVMLYFITADIRMRMARTMFITLLIGAFLWLVFIIAIPYWLMGSIDLQIRTASSGRLDLWYYVLTSMSEHFWLGWGPMSFTWAESKPLPNAHPHNSIMQILYEYGAIAAVLLVSWAFNLVYRWLTWIKSSQSISSIPVTYAVLSALIYSLFSGITVMPFAQLMLVFLIAMQIQCREASFIKVQVWPKVFTFLLVTVASLMLLSTYKHEELLPALFPRIWINGLIGY